jgi:hypothetical protein
VKNPITNPAHNPEAVQMNACHGSLVSLENTFTPNAYVGGRDRYAER